MAKYPLRIRVLGMAEHTSQRGPRLEIPSEVAPQRVGPLQTSACGTSACVTPQSRGYPSPLALQGTFADGGVVNVEFTVSGTESTIVSFEDCTITGNNARQVSLKRPIMMQCIQGPGGVQMGAMAPAGASTERLGK